MRTILLAVTVLSLGLASGCSSAAEDLCDAVCDCEGCSDKEYEHCVIEGEASADVADAYGCSSEYDELSTCVIDKGDCDNDDFELDGDDCDNESEDLADCIDDASDYGDGDVLGSGSSSSGGGTSQVCFEYASICKQCGGDSAACDSAAQSLVDSQCQEFVDNYYANGGGC